MTGVQRPRVQTTPTTAEWAHSIARAWRQLLPYPPTVPALAVLWAQFALETGRGKSCFNFNLGNIKRVDGDGRDFVMLRTFEYVNGKRIDIDDSFRAFDSLDDGALDYLRFLCRPAYAEPWTCVVQGDADAFARALKRKGYYTAPVEEYARGIHSLAAEFTRVVGALPDEDTPVPDTIPETAEGRRTKSSQTMKAVNAPIVDWTPDTSGAATPLRGGSGEHTVRTEDPDLEP
jgi:hypothetical protein